MLSGRFGDISLALRRCAQREISQDPLWLRSFNEHEDRVGLATYVLTGLGLEVPIQTLGTAREARAIVRCCERLDAQCRPGG